jgi:hypothetical protein
MQSQRPALLALASAGCVDELEIVETVEVEAAVDAV